MVQFSHLYLITGKAIALTIQKGIVREGKGKVKEGKGKGKVIFLLFNMLSRFVIVFLPRSSIF